MLKKQDSAAKSSILFWLCLAFTLFFLFYSPFQTALFNGYSAQFESPIYSALFTGSLLFLLTSVFLFDRFNLQETRDILGITVWLVPLTFFLSALTAASPHLAKNMYNIHIMYAIFFITCLYLCSSKLGAALIQLGITLSGYVVVLYGLANMFGNAHFRDAIMLTNQGYRLTSVFQYANAYAALLMAILLCCLYYITTSRKWYIALSHALMLVPIITSFWLTLSRGGIVTLPIIFLCVLPLLTLARQVFFTLYAGIGLLAAFPIIDPITERSTKLVQQVWSTINNTALNPDKTAATFGFFHGESLAGWGIILITSLITAGVIILLHIYALPYLERKMDRFSTKKASKFIIPAGIVVLSAISLFLLFTTGLKQLLPDTVEQRLNTINFQENSVLERATFYNDSLKIIKDYPFLGAGGGGWAALYEKYQNNPYVSRQAHNFFLQYLVEVGIVGFLILLALIICIFVPLFRKIYHNHANENHYAIFFFTTITLLIHSSLDFEMSYVYLGALLFLSLGGLAAALDGRPKWMEAVSKQRWVRWSFPSIMAVIAIIFFITSMSNFSANKQYQKALLNVKSQKPLNEFMDPLNEAIKSQPGHPDYLLLKSNILSQLYSQTKDEKYYNELKNVVLQAKEAEPNNRPIADAVMNMYLMKNERKIAHELAYQAIERYTWEISYYNTAAGLNLDLWNQFRQEKNTTEMNKFEGLLHELYNTVSVKTKELEALPEGQLQGRPFFLTPNINFSIGQVEFIKGNFEKAATYLQPAAATATLEGTPDQLTRERNYLRWYLANLKKLNQSDKPLYDKLIAKWPDEAQQIEGLVNSKF